MIGPKRTIQDKPKEIFPGAVTADGLGGGGGIGGSGSGLVAPVTVVPPGKLAIYDEGVLVGYIDRLDIVGVGGSAAVSGSRGTLTLPDQIAPHVAEADPHTQYLKESLIDAKGDLIVGTANDTPARRAVGADGQVLTADSTQPDGVKWATPAAGATPGTNIQDVGSANSAGTGDSEFARDDHVHEGVHSIAVNGEALIHGDTKLIAGPGIVLIQTGNGIVIAASCLGGCYEDGDDCAGAADFDFSDTAWDSVDDSELALNANTTYAFHYFGTLETLDATQGGQLSVDFSGTHSALECTVYFPGGSSTPYTFSTEDGGTLQTTGPGGGGGAFHVYGTITVTGTGGDLVLRVKGENNIPAGSNLIHACFVKNAWVAS